MLQARSVGSNAEDTSGALSRRRLNLETHALAMLKKTDNHKKIIGPGVASRSEHPHEAFGWNARGLGEFGKTDCGIDVIPQNGLGRGDIAGEHGQKERAAFAVFEMQL